MIFLSLVLINILFYTLVKFYINYCPKNIICLSFSKMPLRHSLSCPFN